MDPLKERIELLRTYLKSISDDNSLDSIASRLESASGSIDSDEDLQSSTSRRQSSSGSEELGVRIVTPDNKVNNALESLQSLVRYDDQKLDDAGLDDLEAIIHKVGRPVIDIMYDTYYTPKDEVWSGVLSGESKKRINKAIKSVGRVEISNVAYPYAGTGFIVGDNILMTNRHVAQMFVAGVGTEGLLFDPSLRPGVDFKREIVPPLDEPEVLSIDKVLMVHPYFDMALLRVSGLDMMERVPLSLSAALPESLLDKNIVVIGYPSKDRRNDMLLQFEIFNNRFEVKRMAPGKYRGRVDYNNRKQQIAINSISHDGSTLAGNSGSCVVDTECGTVVGLHFAGEYLKTNYAVSMNDLAKDARVVDTGINFVDISEPSNEFYGEIWRDVEDKKQDITVEEGLFSGKVEASPHVSKFSISSLFDQEPDNQTYLSAALASHVAYMDEEQLKPIVENEWDFDSCQFLQSGNTECFIAQKGDDAMISFRGTELRLVEWLGNLNILTTKTNYGDVHSGFLAAFKAIEVVLKQEILSRNIKNIVLTGHSLGGAIAVLVAMEWSAWLKENNMAVRNILTYGQPAVGKGISYKESLKTWGTYHRVVLNNDVVTRLPPTYSHTGKIVYLGVNGFLSPDKVESTLTAPDIDDHMISTEKFFELKTWAKNSSSNAYMLEEGILPSIADHSIFRYVDNLLY